MGYRKIENLYKNQTILMFKECWAMEKVHGTSQHLTWSDGQLTFFSGGEPHDKFVSLWDQEFLKAKFTEHFPDTSVTIFGEGYGGKQQGMKDTYGPDTKFIAFEVVIADKWLDVPKAEVSVPCSTLSSFLIGVLVPIYRPWMRLGIALARLPSVGVSLNLRLKRALFCGLLSSSITITGKLG